MESFVRRFVRAARVWGKLDQITRTWNLVPDAAVPQLTSSNARSSVIFFRKSAGALYLFWWLAFNKEFCSAQLAVIRAGVAGAPSVLLVYDSGSRGWYRYFDRITFIPGATEAFGKTVGSRLTEADAYQFAAKLAEFFTRHEEVLRDKRAKKRGTRSRKKR